MKVLAVFGTRPEAIKMCPLVQELKRHPEIETAVCLTGQHREMLRQVIDVFQTKVDYALDIMRPGQNLFTITADILEKLAEPLAEWKPDLVLVHGDTTTSFAAGLAAFYAKIPVGHVEAGLRTGDHYSPFPEEMNRRLTGQLATLHFAPTARCLENLKRENIRKNLFLTGNTVIDAFHTTLKEGYIFHNSRLQNYTENGRRTILLTAHRRENWGEPLRQIFEAVRILHDAFPDLQFIYPVHPNPIVKEAAEHLLGDLSRVFLVDPLDVTDMHNLLHQSDLVMTDSGGLQEEAPHCGVPVVVLREETERPEAVESGTAVVAGTETEKIVSIIQRLLTDEQAYQAMSKAVNPYGDGQASRRIAEAILAWFQAGENID